MQVDLPVPLGVCRQWQRHARYLARYPRGQGPAVRAPRDLRRFREGGGDFARVVDHHALRGALALRRVLRGQPL